MRVAEQLTSSSFSPPGTIEECLTVDARSLLDAGRSKCLGYGPEGQRSGEGTRVFVQSFAPPPRMLVFGATDHAAAVARMGAFLGYQVTVWAAGSRPANTSPGRSGHRPRVSVS